MLFVKNEDLKAGMRLAKPIYNRNGVLLFERDSKLSSQAINSIHNFGLIGVYILEPAEPLPPITEEELEFERFQTVQVFALQEEMEYIRQYGKAQKIESIVGHIVRQYGHRDSKMHFQQNLRTTEDHLIKHVLNVAVLSTMMAHYMNIRIEEQNDVTRAALVHELDLLYKQRQTQDKALGYGIIEMLFPTKPAVKRTVMQLYQAPSSYANSTGKILITAQILRVAEAYDTMTAMRYGSEPQSEVTAIRTLFEQPEWYEQSVVKALLEVIYVLAPGTCVELNTGEKALVLTSNELDILRPVVLSFRDNQVLDLSGREMYDIRIADIMKTMDNRYVMDYTLLNKHVETVDNA